VDRPAAAGTVVRRTPIRRDTPAMQSERRKIAGVVTRMIAKADADGREHGFGDVEVQEALDEGEVHLVVSHGDSVVSARLKVAEALELAAYLTAAARSTAAP
jgi:hypothetical protein